MPHATRVALITGCGKPIGIGNSTARILAARGVAVVVSDVRPAGVANEFNAPGDTDANWGGVDSPGRADHTSRRHRIVGAGRRQPGGRRQRMVEEVLARYGRLDILVNNAGAPQGADRNEIEDVPVAAWDLTMGVNAKGAFLMSRAAVPAMRKAKWGRIVSVSSKAAFRPGTQARHLRRVEGGDRRLHQIPGAGPRALSGSPSTRSVPGRSAPRARSAPTAANTATISRWASASARRRSRWAASANPTRSPR